MVRYVRLTNGSTTMLVNPNNNSRLNELIEDGFYLDKDSQGNYKTFDSNILLGEDNSLQHDILKNLQEQYETESIYNKNKSKRLNR